jgi:hypothetical protein
MRDKSEHEQSESSLRAGTSKIARLSEGKPLDLQRKGRTITASHGTLAGSINSRHGFVVLCCGVFGCLPDVVGSAVKCSSGNLCVFVDVEAVMVCALRVNCWSSTHSLLVSGARPAARL